MLIKSIAVQNIKKTSLFIFILFCIAFVVYFSIIYKLHNYKSKDNLNHTIEIENSENENSISEYIEESKNDSKSYIKWVDFKGNAEVLSKLANLDIASHNNNDDIKLNWIELMAYLGCKYGGDLDKFNQADLNKLLSALKSGTSMQELSKDYKLYNYFYESYDAIFHEYIGNYTSQVLDENGNKTYKTIYGLKAFAPIAKNYSFSHYKDFRCLTFLWLQTCTSRK